MQRKNTRRTRRDIEMSFQAVAPSRQQRREMAEGLRTLATWLLRRHRRDVSDGTEKPLDFPGPSRPTGEAGGGRPRGTDLERRGA